MLEMGRKFLNSGTFSFFLGVGETSVSLSTFGMKPSFNVLLSILVKTGSTFSRHSLSNEVGMGSEAHDLVGDANMYFRTSSEEIVPKDENEVLIYLLRCDFLSSEIGNVLFFFLYFRIKKARKLIS